jgi:hypothetical protein
MIEQLRIDLSEPDDDMIKRQAAEAVACGDFLNLDHAYESLWDAFETELYYQAAA